MSIRAKLLLPIMAVVVAVLVTSHFIAFAALKDNLVVERFRSEQRALDLVALAIVPDVLGGDLGKIHETLNEVRQRHTWWKSVTLTGRSGNRLYPLQAEPPLADLAGLTSEIASPSGTVGRLAIAFDMNALVETALVVLWRLEGVMTAILVLGGIIVVALQNRWFVAPLLRLSEASRLLSEGRYDAPLPPPSSDEVGGLIRSFDSMREAVGLRERALRDGERRLQAVIDNSAEAVLSLSAAGQILSLNAAAEHMFRASAKSMIGWGIQTLIPATAFSIVPIQAVSGIELEAMREDGERFPVWLTASEARLDDETILVATVVDLTERKRTEQQLKDSEGRFRDLAVSASDWFWETDEDNRLTFVSDRIGEILGVKPSGVLGFTYFDFGLSDYDPAQAQAHAEDLDAHRPFRDLTFAVGPEGAKDGKVIRISGMPFFNEDGAFIGYRGVGADITREAEAERRARLAQQQLADAIESINDGIALFDSEDRLVLCNQEYRRVFWQLGDMLVPGTRFESIIRDERTQTLFDPGEMGLDEWTNQRLQRHTQASGEPFLIRMTDGRWISSREYRTNDGGVVGVRADITEMKLREQALETLKHRYQLILDSAGDGIVELSGDGQVGFANRVAADLLQIEPAEMIGRHFAQLVQASADDAAVITGACTNGVAERVNNAEFRRNADAMAIPVEFLAAPIIENDVANGGVLVFRDISLRKHYEQVLADQHSELERLVAVRTTALSQEIKNRTAIETALRGSRQHLKGITDSLFEGVLVVNGEWRVTFANPSARRLLGLEGQVGVLEHQCLDELIKVTGSEDAPWRRSACQGEVIRNDDATFEVQGRSLAVAFTCSPFLDEGGKRGAIISFRDIEAIKQAQREAMQASRLASVGQLAAGIAHEINTPIQYIGDNLGFIRSAAGEIVPILDSARALAKSSHHGDLAPLAEEFDRRVEAASLDFLLEELPGAIEQSLDGVAQVARIVLSMKEFSHPGSTQKSAVDINRALDSTLTVSRSTWKHIAQVVTQFDPVLPMVYCHPGEMNQVFLNLIVNAAHAIEESGKPLPGTIRVSTRAEGDWVEIEVADSGTGIPEQIRERIFDPFFTTKVVGKGTGQGLSICYDVAVAKHGGQILVGGRPGEGAIFTLRLPIGGIALSLDE